MPHSFIFVIAGSYDEAKKWAQEVDLKDHQWKYVFNSKTVSGKWHDHKFAAVGTFKDRPDYYKLRMFVRLIRPNFAQGWEFERK